RGSDPRGHGPDAAARGREREVRVPGERRAVLEGLAVSRQGRRDADLDREERDEVGASDPSPRLLLPAARRTASTDPSDSVEGHARRADGRHDPLRRRLRRAARHVDVPLPYPGSCRRRPDGPRAPPPGLARVAYTPFVTPSPRADVARAAGW